MNKIVKNILCVSGIMVGISSNFYLVYKANAFLKQVIKNKLKKQ